MSFRRFPLGRVLLIAALVAGIGLLDRYLSRARSVGKVSPNAPRLLVLVVFDQLRGDYLSRWNDLFEKDGFRRLEEKGAWFQNCHYPYAHTVTGAGHASLLTGCSPDQHGIVGNNWYERRQESVVYCVGSDRHELVPAPPVSENAKRKPRPQGASPERLLAPTVGDVLKEATGGRSRIVAVSLKDRSCVLPGGHRPDACYWFDDESGRFVTSTYYRGRPHPWVADFNQHEPRVADRWFGRTWDCLRTDVDYDRWAGPDDMVGEGKGYAQGRVFPHPFGEKSSRPGRGYYRAVYNSPFGNDLLLEFTKRAIDAEQLGKGPAPDLLCISFSSNDPIGHVWGPDSHEVLDVTLRSDRIVRDLLNYLDERVGAGQYLLALSADHGVCPLPEVSRSKGIDAQRVPLDVEAAESFLDQMFGQGTEESRWLEQVMEPWFYLNQRLLRQRRLDSAKVEEALAGWLRQQPGIAATYTRTQLNRGIAVSDAVGKRVRKSFQAERCGDVAIVLKPYYLLSSPFRDGTTHGQPHPYDTHVPLLVYGPGIRGGIRREPVTPQAIAAIFTHFLGISPPARIDAKVPETLVDK